VIVDPTDTARVAQLEQKTAELKATRGAGGSGKALLAITNAQIALGQYDSASLYLDKTEKIAPGADKIDSTRQVLTKKIKLREDFSNRIHILNDQMDQLKQSPGDTGSVRQIVKTLSDLEVPAYVHTNELVTLARSYAVTGNPEQSLQVMKKLSESASPGDPDIHNLKDSIQNNTYQKQFFKHAAPPKIKLPGTVQNKQMLDHAVIQKLQ
jgi:hypothetical protein